MAESFTIRLPNLFEISKNFPLSLNPHYNEKFIEESKTWIRQYLGEREAPFFDDDLEILCAHAFPLLDLEEFHLVVDYNNYLFLTDDLAEGCEEASLKMMKTVWKILDDVDAEVDCNDKMAAATKDILHRIRSKARPHEYQSMMDNFRHYIQISFEEAKRQKKGLLLDLETFRKHRPILAGCEIWFTLAIVGNKIQMPIEIYENENFIKLQDAASEMLWITNDVYSYAKEYRTNLTNTNLATILMKTHNCSLQEAFDEVGRIYQDNQNIFDENKKILEETVDDAEVHRYIQSLETFIIGNMQWSATTTRYSSKEENVKATHVIKLYKKHEI